MTCRFSRQITMSTYNFRSFKEFSHLYFYSDPSSIRNSRVLTYILRITLNSKASMLSLPVRKPKIPQTQKIVYENWLETYSINLTLVNQSYSYIACSGISDQIHGGYFQLIGHMTSPVPSQGSIPRCQLQKLPDRKNARNMSVYPNQNLHWKLGR